MILRSILCLSVQIHLSRWMYGLLYLDCLETYLRWIQADLDRRGHSNLCTACRIWSVRRHICAECEQIWAKGRITIELHPRVIQVSCDTSVRWIQADLDGRGQQIQRHGTHLRWMSADLYRRAHQNLFTSYCDWNVMRHICAEYRRIWTEGDNTIYVPLIVFEVSWDTSAHDAGGSGQRRTSKFISAIRIYIYSNFRVVMSSKKRRQIYVQLVVFRVSWDTSVLNTGGSGQKGTTQFRYSLSYWQRHETHLRWMSADLDKRVHQNVFPSYCDWSVLRHICAECRRIWSRRVYGVASASRIDTIIGLFCKRALYKRLYSAKETCNFIDPTDRSHPIAQKKPLLFLSQHHITSLHITSHHITSHHITSHTYNIIRHHMTSYYHKKKMFCCPLLTNYAITWSEFLCTYLVWISYVTRIEI